MDARKHGHETRDKAKYHERKQRTALTTLVDTRQRAYVHLDNKRLRLSVVKLQDDRGYDELPEDEKYNIIMKAVQAKVSGVENVTIPLKYEAVTGGSYQKQYRPAASTRMTQENAGSDES